MKRLVLIILLILKFIDLFAQVKLSGKEFGFTQGNFRVSESGALTYTLPIQVSPGTGGTQPNLNIAYNHQSGEGMMGIGWNIQGLSIISRIPQSRANDEEPTRNSLGKQFSFDRDDKFALDGQLLVLAPQDVTTTPSQLLDGKYGLPQTTYFTENNSFSKVVIKDTVNNAPKSFVVYTKSGLIMEYGNTADARIEAQGKTTPIHWLVNKITDTKGNYITFKYNENQSTGEFLPALIEYTGNDKAFLLPYASVVFQYESAPQLIERYQSGSKITISQRLTSIECRYKTDVVRKYAFTYENVNFSAKSYLVRIQESVGTSLLDPLNITWKNGNPFIDDAVDEKLFNTNTLKVNESKPRLAYFGDWDGDGLQDMMIHVLKSDHKYPIFYQTFDGKRPFNTVIFHQNLGSAEDSEWRPINGYKSQRYNQSPFDVTPPTFDENNISYFLVTDFNADGKSDLVWYRPKDGANYFYLNASDGATIKFIYQKSDSFSLPSPNKLFTSAFEVNARDFNGDGLNDLLFYSRKGDGFTKNYVWRTESPVNNSITASSLKLSSFPDGLIKQGNGWDLPISKSDTSQIYTEDFNGDGLLDVMAINDAKASKNVAGETIQDGNVRFFPQKNYQTIKDGRIIYTNEFDTKSVTPFEVPIASLYVGAGKPAKLIKNYNDIIIADFNNDGLPDIFIYGFNYDAFQDARRFSFYINKGDFSFTTPKNDQTILADGSSIFKTLQSLTYKVFVRDVNIDGLPDLLFVDGKINYTLLNRGNFLFSTPIKDYASINAKYYYLRGNYLSNGKQSEFYFDYVSGNNIHRYPKQDDQFINNVVESIQEPFKEYTATYSTLFDKSVYSNSSLTTYQYPLTKGTVPMNVVSKIDLSANLNFRTFTYTYEGAVFDLRGRGFRGFEETSVYDIGKNNTQTKFFEYSKDYRLDPLKRIAVYSGTFPNPVLLSNNFLQPSVFTGSVSKAYFNFPQQSRTIEYNPTLQKVNNLTDTRQRVDAYGNVISLATDYGNGIIDSVVNVYVNNEQKWYLGRLTKATVYKQVPGKPLQTNSSSFDYDTDSGLLIRETTNADADEKLQLTKTYTYDALGNVIKSTTRAWNGKAWEERTITTKMDVQGRFIISKTNPLGHSANNKYDEKTGHLLQTTDANGLTTTYEYDVWGRKRKVILPDGNWTSQDFYYQSDPIFGTPYECQSNCQNTYPNLAFVIFKQSSVAPDILEYYDELGRNIGSRTNGFSGQNIYEYRRYSPVTDSKIDIEYNRFTDGETPQAKAFTYDNYKRLIKIDYPGGRSTHTEFNGNSTTSYNALNQRKTVTKNTKDQIIKVVDEQGNSLSYDYDGNGNILKTTDPKGNNITAEFDFRGYKVKSTDPNIGTFLYEYNGFGELIRQTNAKGQTTDLIYDLLGRVTSQTEKEGVTVWTYDNTMGAALGKVASVSYTVGNVRTDYEYDKLGRLITEKQQIEGKTYSSRFTYDAKGRPATYTYPSGYQVGYKYNSWGFLESLQRISDNTILWLARSRNSQNQLTSQEFGNGVLTNYRFDPATNELLQIYASKNDKFLLNYQYSYDNLSNLTQRKDLQKNLQERFTYDNLNRLVISEVVGVGVISIGYDVLGNITSKSDAGIYEYGAVNNGPHQVVRVTPFGSTSATVCLPSLEINTEYSSFDKVTKIANDTAYINISYGTSKQRIIQKMYVHDKLVRTKIYVNNSYEVEITPNETREIHYLRSDNGVIGTFIKNDKGQSRTEYWHKDNLGSLAVITDEQGKVVREFSYDAWGKRRNPDWTPLTSASKTEEAAYERGFTTHEHYDLFDLVDMNGRIYDPVLGRFLSPDPFVQDISNIQSFNRYSYVLNNPLAYTDPSGYLSFGDFHFPNPFKSGSNLLGYLTGTTPFIGVTAGADWAFDKGSKWLKDNWKTVVVIAVVAVAAAATGGALGAVALTWYGSVIVGAAAGFAGSFTGTLLNGGTLGKALAAGGKGAEMGAINSLLTFGVGEIAQDFSKNNNYVGAFLAKTIGHAYVGGFMAQLQGGKVTHGLWSGAASGAVGPAENGIDSEAARIAISATVGGTVSLISGGTFENGAVTGAFVRLFNDELHDFAGNAKDVYRAQQGEVEDAAKGLGNVLSEFESDDAAIASDGVKKAVYITEIQKGLAETLGGAALFLSTGPLPEPMTKGIGGMMVMDGLKTMYDGYQGFKQTLNHQMNSLQNKYEQATILP